MCGCGDIFLFEWDGCCLEKSRFFGMYAVSSSGMEVGLFPRRIEYPTTTLAITQGFEPIWNIFLYLRL